MLTVLAGLFLISPSTESPGLQFYKGWVRALPPGSGMTVAYGELRNSSNQEIALESFDSNAFVNVSLHQSIMENGVSRMQEKAEVVIAAGSSLKLEPGGLHLMMMNPTMDVQPGDEVEISISGGGHRYSFTLPVEQR